MRRLSAYGISGWSWLNALGRHAYALGQPHPDYLLDPRGLTPHAPELGLPGFWGRVPGELPRLPGELLRHQSRCAELLCAALEPLREVLAEAKRKYGSERVAVVLGSSTGGIDATERALRYEREHGLMPDDFFFEEAHVYNALVCLVRELLGLEGVGFVISTACSSSGKALGAAQRLLEVGQADAVLCGGIDALCEMTLRGFAGLGILAAGGCRPFDRTRSGISIGEGAALLVLERDCPSPYRLLGVGESNDAYHATAPHPEGLGARLAMERALEMAGLDADVVGYVNAHGTGTEQNDRAESLALRSVFGQTVRFSSTKDRVGHQLGTAGATEALFCLHALQLGEIPDNRVPDERDDELALQPVTTREAARPTVALSNSFAFGGSNVSVLLGKRGERSLEEPTAPPELLRVFLRRVSLWSPELPSVEAWFEGARSPVVDKAPALGLSPRQRGRSSPLTRLFAELYGQLLTTGPEGSRFDEKNVALFCGSAYGEMSTTLALLDQLGVDATLSPAKFQSSVHNTAAGLLTMNAENRGFSTALAAGPSSFAMTLLDAVGWLRLQGGEALVLVADEKGPERMLRGSTFPALGVGLELTARATPPPGAVAEIGSLELTTLTSRPNVEGALADAPAAWGLELVERFSSRRAGPVRLGPRLTTELSFPSPEDASAPRG